MSYKSPKANIGSMVSALLRNMKRFSYTWGSVENPIIIKSDAGGSFLATRNLVKALFRLHYSGKQRVLCVDAICINQDNVEKAQ